MINILFFPDVLLFACFELLRSHYKRIRASSDKSLLEKDLLLSHLLT